MANTTRTPHAKLSRIGISNGTSAQRKINREAGFSQTTVVLPTKLCAALKARATMKNRNLREYLLDVLQDHHTSTPMPELG